MSEWEWAYRRFDAVCFGGVGWLLHIGLLECVGGYDPGPYQFERAVQ